ncbi:hypothetical protein [Maricaulis sp.]|uniref:hypothetical protein n=1 Tax=Maricaulis sp. TaxID=1486257 RepID=UPI003A8D2D4D
MASSGRSDPAAIAQALGAARAAGQAFDPLTRFGPLSLEAGYAIAALRCDPAQAAAYKLGGTTGATRTAFAVSRAYAGALCADQLIKDGQDLPTGLINPVVEPEILLAFDRPFAPQRAARSVQALRDELAWVGIALEVPATPVSGLPQTGVGWLLADCCAAGALVVGEQLSPAHLDTLSQARVTLQVGTRTSQGEASRLLDGALGAMSDILAVFGQLGWAVPAGIPFATGGLAPALPIGAGETVQAGFAGPGIELSISTRLCEEG